MDAAMKGHTACCIQPGVRWQACWVLGLHCRKQGKQLRSAVTRQRGTNRHLPLLIQAMPNPFVARYCDNVAALRKNLPFVGGQLKFFSNLGIQVTPLCDGEI